MNQNQIRACYQKAVSLFNEKMGTDYSIENPKLFLVDRDNESYVFEEIAILTGKATSTFAYTTMQNSFLNEAMCEAFLGDLSDAIAVNLPMSKFDDEEHLVFKFAHELGHVFALHRELKDVYFAERYYNENPDHMGIRAGYEIWKEFVADYIAQNVCAREAYSLHSTRPFLQQVVKKINPVSNPYYYKLLSSYLACVLYSQEAEGGWDNLRKAMRSYKLPYTGMTEILFHHLATQSYWVIDEEFLQQISDACIVDAIESACSAA